MTVPWLAADNPNPEPPAPTPPPAWRPASGMPSKHLVSEALWRHGRDDIVAQACPWWLRHELTDIAWGVAPAAVIGLGMPDALFRFYLAVLVAAGVWAALRWSHLQGSLERARRHNTSSVVLEVAEQIRTADPSLAFDIAINDHWNPQLAKAFRASLADAVR